jgi:hypothetical protein
LEDDLDRAGQLVLHARQRGRRAEQDGHVVVVAAGMHDADFLAVPLRLGVGFERQVALFGDRQCVHVGPQRHHRARQAALQHANHAGGRDVGRDLETKLAQLVRNDPGGPRFAVAELGVLVEVAAPGNDLRGQLDGQLVDSGR